MPVKVRGKITDADTWEREPSRPTLPLPVLTETQQARQLRTSKVPQTENDEGQVDVWRAGAAPGIAPAAGACASSSRNVAFPHCLCGAGVHANL